MSYVISAFGIKSFVMFPVISKFSTVSKLAVLSNTKDVEPAKFPSSLN